MALVLEQRDDGVRPVGDVVARLRVADRLEAHQQRVELLVAELVGGFGGDRRALGLRLARLGEADQPLASSGGLRELLEQLVDAPVALRLQGRDGAGEVRAVMVRSGHRFSSPAPESPRSGCAGPS